MKPEYLQIRKIAFDGPKKHAEVEFVSGLNVICGASDTGKSFLAESIDYMLGGSELREFPERTPYENITLSLNTGVDVKWSLERSTLGGDFKLSKISDSDVEDVTLKQSHRHDKTNNLSGFLLDSIGLFGKRILRKLQGDTQSLSFRNIARLIIIQEDEIQQKGSPFRSAQYMLKTPELATVKLLLTGIDDGGITIDAPGPDNSKQIALIVELLSDLTADIGELPDDQEDVSNQLLKLRASIDEQRDSLDMAQRKLTEKVTARKEVFGSRRKIEGRLDDISELLVRFDLLQKHYHVDIERLEAIQESGSLFTSLTQASCPLCGAPAEARHSNEKCDGDVSSIVTAASAEISKIQRLRTELGDTVSELHAEARTLNEELEVANHKFDKLELEIQSTVAPIVNEEQSSFSDLLEMRSSVQQSLEVYEKATKLEERKQSLIIEQDQTSQSQEIVSGLPKSAAHDFSLKVSQILKAWDFPGDCHIHFDSGTCDFVIDGKPRGSRGKGLRAITHAAVTLGMLEYCQENGLPHPGFIVLDSPLLAYFKPEGDDEQALKGTNLKECFYSYLLDQHSAGNTQIIIIENQHPPENIVDKLAMTVFTGNPHEGRFGLL